MITNERQYRITKAEADKFRDAVENFDPLEFIKIGIDPVIAEAQKRALESQLQDLQESLQEYDDLQSGAHLSLTADSIEEIGVKLIAARIAGKLTQKELAVRLSMKPQQIQRYEQERYTSANIKRIAEVAQALGVRCEVKIEFGEAGSRNKGSLKLPFREMRKRGWLESFSVRQSDEFSGDADLATLYVNRHAHRSNALSLLKRTESVRIEKSYDEGALLAWQARILELAGKAQPKSEGFDVAKPEFLTNLVQLSRFEDGPLRAISALADVGVIVVVEKHLEKTHLDGAAMLLENKYPVVGLTLRHDRLDNFGFVLLHELGHIILHRNEGLADGFFDEEKANSTKQVEVEADNFARNAFVPDELWNASLVRFTNDETQVVKFAERLKIHPSIVAGKLRRERNYTLFNSLIGRDKVRAMLSTDSVVVGGYHDD